MEHLRKEMSQTCGKEQTLLFLLQLPLVSRTSKPGHVRLGTKDKTIDVPQKILEELAGAGVIVRHQNQIVLTPAGRELAERLGSRENLELHTLSEFSRDTVATTLAAFNPSESPLGALHARIRPDGNPFLTQEEFDAGERLRFDFSKGLLLPSISANWQVGVSAGRRSNNNNGTADLTDTALAARSRFQLALESLGDQLGGVATDICCFLKGFEQVELERRWPKRSAKFMLKAALSVLALHYWPRSARKHQTRHWGADDYKPSLRNTE